MTDVSVPIEWVALQGLEAGVASFSVGDVYRAFATGTDPMETWYARTLPHPDMRGRIEELREACSRPLALDPPLPVVLTARGRYELLDGHHRAARALHDGWTNVPVRVEAVSPLWQRLVDDLSGIYPGHPTRLYQPIEHPYFEAWAVDRAADRVTLVFDALAEIGLMKASGPYMEIGSCTGRFCREASLRGWLTFGLEQDPMVRGVAEYLDLVFGLHTTYYGRGDPDVWLADVVTQMGVIVCLSVFHRHIHQKRHEWVRALYRRCIAQSRAFIVDCGSPNEAALLPSPVPLDRAGFAAWLQDIAGSKTVRAIGETEGRVIYLVA